MKIVKKQVGDLKVGDKLLGSDGKPTEITNLYEIHKPKKMYQLEFEDGTIIKSGDTHLWYCETKQDLEYKKAFEQRLLSDIFIVNEKELITLNALGKRMANNKEDEYFYKRAAQSLGWESEIEGSIRLYDMHEVYIHLMRMKNKEIPIRVGRVRTAEEIFDLFNRGVEFEIPQENK